VALDLQLVKEEVERNGSWKSAMSRRKMSKPMRIILDDYKSILKDGNYRMLDYGCGRGDDLNYIIDECPWMEGNIYGYDPHFFPDMPEGNFYLITCFYVLNVIPKELEGELIHDVMSRLTYNGIAVFATRKDIKKEEQVGNYTQRPVILPCIRTPRSGFLPASPYYLFDGRRDTLKDINLFYFLKSEYSY
jgi:hypothetical protein